MRKGGRKKHPREKVEVGQIWESVDARDLGRQIRVDRIEGGYAYCTPYIGAHPDPRKTRIRLDRMYPHSTGFRLVGKGRVKTPARIVMRYR